MLWPLWHALCVLLEVPKIAGFVSRSPDAVSNRVSVIAGTKETHMKNLLLSATLAALVGAAAIQAAPKPSPDRPLKIFLSPASNIPKADIMKNLSDKCPNVSITLDPKKSDYMVEARWVGRYDFTVFKHGGDAVYGTQTALLHNAVKDVCHYMNTHQP